MNLEKENEGKDNRNIFFHFVLFYFSKNWMLGTLYVLPNLISETTLTCKYCYLFVSKKED